jgi:hypothetical protein
VTERGPAGAMSRWAVFDLNGTLIDPARVGPDALDAAGPRAMTLNRVGEYRPFPELLEFALVSPHAPKLSELAFGVVVGRPDPLPGRPHGPPPSGRES